MEPTPVAEAARRLGLTLQEMETVKEGSGFHALAEFAPDVLAVVAYGEILPKTVLDLPAVAPVNVHFSLLPELRGAAPVQRAILDGLGVTGVTTIEMDEGMDTGPVLLQAQEPIEPTDNAETLGARLAALGGALLVETLDGLEAGTLEGRPQDGEGATYALKLRPADRLIDWSQPSQVIVRQVRALAPEPGAATSFRGKALKVLSARRIQVPVPTDGDHATEPGRVARHEEGLGVWSGDGLVILDEVQPEGRRRMGGADFVRGYRPQDGESLG